MENYNKTTWNTNDLITKEKLNKIENQLEAITNNMIENNNNMIVPTEATNTARMAHAVGDYFVLDDTLYVATAAIAAGDTIVTSGSEANCRAAVLGNEAAGLKSALTLDMKGQTYYPALKTGHFINSSGKWGIGAAYTYAMIPVSGSEVLEIKAGSSTCIYAFLKSDYSDTATVDYADGVTGRVVMQPGTAAVVSVPTTSKYLYVLVNNTTAGYNQWLYWPEKLLINGENISWPVRYSTDQNRELALSAMQNANGVGIPYLRDAFSIGSDDTWKVGDYKYVLFPIAAGDIVTITAGAFDCFFAFIEHDVIPGENRVAFAGNETTRRTISAGNMATVTAPVGTVYLYVLYSIGVYNYYPKKLSVNGIDYIGTVRQFGSGAFKYETGTFLNGVATERLTIGFPNGEKFVGYVLYRYVYPDNNCNIWRVFSFNIFDNALNSTVSLSAKGEIECAVSLQGRPDFSGGSTHGDEIMNTYAVFVDGEEITSNLSSYGQKMPFRDLRLVRQSTLYDPNDHTTAIADHGVEYIFADGTLTINQSLKWLVADTLSNCYMAMFTPEKSYTDHYYTDVSFEPSTYPGDNYGLNIPGAKHAVAYGADGFWGEFWVEQYPEGMTGGDRMLLTDNSGNAYNKMYYVICNAGQTSIGELWKTTTKYKIKFN